MSDSKPYQLAELAEYLRTRFPDVESARTPWLRKRPDSVGYGIGYFRDLAVPFCYLQEDSKEPGRNPLGYVNFGGVMDPKYPVDFRYSHLFEWADVWQNLIDACANRRGYLLPDPQIAGMRWALKKARDDDREHGAMISMWDGGSRVTAPLPDVVEYQEPVP